MNWFPERLVPWGTITRWVWMALLCTIVLLFVVGAPILWSHVQIDCSGDACSADASSAWMAQSRAALGLSAAQVATYFVTLDALGVVGYTLISGLLVWRRPDDRMAVVGAFALLLFGGVSTCDSVRTLEASVPTLSGVVRGLAAFGAAGVAICFCVFPDGRFVPRWTTGVAILVVGAAAANTVTPRSPLDVFNWSPLVVLPYVAVILCVQLYRYHRVSSFTQRQQTKWIILGLAVTGIVYAAYVMGIDFIREGLPVNGSPVVAIIQLGVFVPLAFGLLMLPASIGLAILQHRLFDIDRVITGALVYGALWLGITGAYLALTALVAQSVTDRLPVAVAVSFTLAAVLAAQPARAWLERIARRLVFGNRLSGYELVRTLGNSLELAPEPDQLATRLASTLREGLGITWVRVWMLGDSGDAHLVASEGVDRSVNLDPVHRTDMVHAGEAIGRIECGPKRFGDPFDTRDAEILTTLGRQAALALRTAHLTSELAGRLHELAEQADELAASRMRLVEAEAAGRRRIERDIHDGVQQQLVALMTKTRLARNQLAREPERANATLTELQEDARQALNDLRELAQGIHPAVLEDHGLVYAVESRLARTPLEVTFERTGITASTRLTDAVEGAAYFFVSEALANTLKYAETSRACVRLNRSSDRLTIEVSDDGRGFDRQRVTLRGLRGLADRLEALGGTLHIESSPDGGTRLVATLPAPETAPNRPSPDQT